MSQLIQLFASINLGERARNIRELNDELTIGWAFNVLEPVLISHLGVFDTDVQNALGTIHKVGRWAPNGTLLVQIDVPKTSLQVGGFRYVQISALTLSAGEDYRIGAVFHTSNLPADSPIVLAALKRLRYSMTFDIRSLIKRTLVAITPNSLARTTHSDKAACVCSII